MREDNLLSEDFLQQASQPAASALYSLVKHLIQFLFYFLTNDERSRTFIKDTNDLNFTLQRCEMVSEYIGKDDYRQRINEIRQKMKIKE